jgi:hypothetical protein
MFVSLHHHQLSGKTLASVVAAWMLRIGYQCEDQLAQQPPDRRGRMMTECGWLTRGA